jgi:hypothetical protein
MLAAWLMTSATQSPNCLSARLRELARSPYSPSPCDTSAWWLLEVAAPVRLVLADRLPSKPTQQLRRLGA